MEYIDLHLHSCFSDGTESPDELVRKAKSAGIGMIALTDHNTLAGIDDFRAACRRYSQTGIDGVELSCAWPEKDPASLPPGTEPPEIHVLGYFPPDSDFSMPCFQPLHGIIRDYRLRKIRHNEAIVRKMQDAGITGRKDKDLTETGGVRAVTVEGFRAFARSLSSSGNYNRVHIARYLEDLGVVSSIKEAMDHYIGKKCPYYVTRETITVREAIEAIHAAGGTAVIAHLGEYHLEGDRLEAFFAYCMEHGADGFELLHPHNTPRTAGSILAFARRVRRETGHVLLLTAGSDYHGANKENRQALPWLPPYAWD